MQCWEVIYVFTVQCAARLHLLTRLVCDIIGQPNEGPVATSWNGAYRSRTSFCQYIDSLLVLVHWDNGSSHIKWPNWADWLTVYVMSNYERQTGKPLIKKWFEHCCSLECKSIGTYTWHFKLRLLRQISLKASSHGAASALNSLWISVTTI